MMPTVREIITATARYYSIAPSDILERNREAGVAKPRHVAMYLARRHTNRPLTVIARVFDGMHHTTVMHAVDKVKGQIARRSEIIVDVQNLENILQLHSTTG